MAAGVSRRVGLVDWKSGILRSGLSIDITM